MPGHISRKDENSHLKRYMHPNIHSNTIYNSQDTKQPKCPSADEQIKKVWYIHTTEYDSAIEGERNTAICSNMDGPEIITRSKVNQTKTNII